MKVSDRPKKQFFLRSIEWGVEDDKRTIKGVIPFNSDSYDMEGIIERILPSAFNKTLADKAEVKCLFGHDVTKILGSSNAKTLRMSAEKDGLYFEVDLPNTTDGNDAYELIRRGDCRTLSFGFIPVKQNVTEEKNRTIVELVEVALLEISVCVAFPAYPEGSTNVRSLLRRCKIMDIKELDSILKKRELTQDDKDKISKIVEELSELTKSAEETQSQESTELNTETEKKEDSETVKETVVSEQEETEKKEEEKRARERFIFYAENI